MLLTTKIKKNIPKKILDIARMWLFIFAPNS